MFSISKKQGQAILVIIALSIMVVLPASAYTSGKMGNATSCGGGSCHGASDPGVSVSITGLPVEYVPDQVYPLTISVASVIATTMGGFSLEVSQGTLSNPGVSVQISGDQATHSGSGLRTWTLDWTAPSRHTDSVDIDVAGLASDGSSDGWNTISYDIPESIPDNEAPWITGAYINSQSTRQYMLSAIPDISLSAVLMDVSTGGFNIAGANFTMGPLNWPGTTLPPLDTLDSSTETFELQLAKPTEAGIYTYYPYGWDEYNNYNDTNTEEFATLEIIDDVAPDISDVLLDGLASKGVYPGTSVTLTAKLNDSATGNSNIKYANYTIGYQNWTGSQPMASLDGGFDSPSETVTASIDTTSLLPGSFDIYVYGNDTNDNFNSTPVAKATLVVSTDQIAPEISNILINGQADPTYLLSNVSETSIILSAFLNDTGRGDSDIEGANFTLGMGNWGSSIDMALDNLPTSTEESLSGSVPAPTEAGLFEYHVYGWDSAFNYNNSASEHAELTILDDVPPEIVPISTSQQLGASSSLTYRLTVLDNMTGNSNIGGVNITIGQHNWSSSIAGIADNALDSSVENFTITLDTTNWSAGVYDLYMYAWDDPAYPGPDEMVTELHVLFGMNTPPELGWPSDTDNADGLHPNVGDINTDYQFSIMYWDDGHLPATGEPKLHIMKDGNEIIDSPFNMSTTSGVDTMVPIMYSHTMNLPAGEYTYYFTAIDGSGLAAIPTDIMTGLVVKESLVPSQVTDITLTSLDNGQVQVDWNYIGDAYLAGFRIYRADSENGTYAEIGNVTAGARTFTDASPGSSPYYKVLAFDDWGNELALTDATAYEIDDELLDDDDNTDDDDTGDSDDTSDVDDDDAIPVSIIIAIAVVMMALVVGMMKRRGSRSEAQAPEEEPIEEPAPEVSEEIEEPEQVDETGTSGQ